MSDKADHTEPTVAFDDALGLCLGCRHVAVTDGPLENGIYRCGECGALMFWGVLMPKVVIQPTGDPRFLDLRIDDRVHKLAAPFAKLVADNLASILVEK